MWKNSWPCVFFYFAEKIRVLPVIPTVEAILFAKFSRKKIDFYERTLLVQQSKVLVLVSFVDECLWLLK